ncbi:MAG: hypothetical protein Q7V05_07805 [Methanoregula sp.]|nr:hypothetical protein [Methanoregula sp.]
MGKSYRYPREHGRRSRNDESSDFMYPDYDAYDEVMDIYADPLDSGSEQYGFNEGDEDDI